MQQFIALLSLTLISPLLILAGLLILILDGLPIFFLQKRLGKQQKLFSIIKFRTMRNDNITAIGKIYRSLGIDELPQLINVLRGEMNFIGPRPLTLNDCDRLGWNTPYYAIRWQTKPGITGLAQLTPICHKKMSWFFDRYYVTHQSVILNIKIISCSLLILIVGKNRVRHWIWK